jgi:hypothetical protein
MAYPNARITNNTQGADYVALTAPQSGTWQALQMLTATKFHTLTGNIAGLANTNSLTAVELPAGLAIYGRFTTFQLHSGSVLAYRE